MISKVKKMLDEEGFEVIKVNETVDWLVENGVKDYVEMELKIVGNDIFPIYVHKETGDIRVLEMYEEVEDVEALEDFIVRFSNKVDSELIEELLD